MVDIEISVPLCDKDAHLKFSRDWHATHEEKIFVNFITTDFCDNDFCVPPKFYTMGEILNMFCDLIKSESRNGNINNKFNVNELVIEHVWVYKGHADCILGAY